MKSSFISFAINSLAALVLTICVSSPVFLFAAKAASSKSPDAPNHTVTQADLDRWKVELSNWGRWGKSDEKGALNLITPAKRKQAAALVKDGFVVSLAHDALTEKTVDNPQPWEDTMTNADPIRSGDKISVQIHGLAHTHMDSLAHHFLDGKMYNGFPQSEYVTMKDGPTKGSIINEKDGIFTRGILIDIARLKGVDYLEPGTPIYVEDLEAWERKTGVKVSAGDALFIRTGRWKMRAKLGPMDMTNRAGLDASVIPWLKQRDVAVLGSEVSLSVVPFPPTTQVTNKDDYLPVHNFVIVALGVTVIDNMDLDALSEACAARNRWSFLLTVAPLPLVHGTGSPVNPTAVF